MNTGYFNALKRVVTVTVLTGVCLCAVLPSRSMITTAYAAEQTGQELGTIDINVRYDNDIIPQDGDEFVILYCVKNDEGNTAEIKFDAAQIYEDGAQIQVPYNSYSILDINYNGPNEKVGQQGYATNRGFYCDERTNGSITVVIGDGVLKRFDAETNGGIKAKDTNHNQWGDAYREHTEEIENNTPVEPESPGNENQTDESIMPVNPETDADYNEYPEFSANDTGEARIEDYREGDEDEDSVSDKESKEKRKKDAITKLVGLAVFAVIGFVALVVFYRKKLK